MAENTPVTDYRPATNAQGNVPDLSALIAAEVERRLAQIQAEAIIAQQPKVISPEEAARIGLDNAGVGLGHHEQLTELYRIVATIAAKVGI